MKKLVAIVAGGDSSEMEVSLKSAAGIMGFIDKGRYEAYVVIIMRSGWYVELQSGAKAAIDKNDFSFRDGDAVRRFDFAYITIHGTPGEDGRLQGYFDMIGMPYSSCGTLASAISFNKFVCNSFLRNFGIRVPYSALIRKGNNINTRELVERIGLPLFIKPCCGGSSFGVTKVNSESQMEEAISKAFSEGDELIAEQNVSGTEVTCGCYNAGKQTLVFPVTEVVSKNEIFDFNAKYKGESEEITPARIPSYTADEVQRITAHIYELLGAKGLIRIDYIINNIGLPIMLDVNTTPGMTPTSFIPQQVAAADESMTEILTDIIENELTSYEYRSDTI
ncbi:MAG: D-alanine--D-alanine ligase [Tannerellaceae bacterium]|jgi:D-alanine-D-alanine ligase|nr:D-alanine--D-alanine ligase [Tannerellaceae bacterium]